MKSLLSSNRKFGDHSFCFCGHLRLQFGRFSRFFPSVNGFHQRKIAQWNLTKDFTQHFIHRVQEKPFGEGIPVFMHTTFGKNLFLGYPPYNCIGIRSPLREYIIGLPVPCVKHNNANLWLNTVNSKMIVLCLHKKISTIYSHIQNTHVRYILAIKSVRP